MNLSKEKRERLLNYLEKLKENKEDEDIRIISEIENALNEKKYGLVWEEHSEKVDEDLKTKIPLFTEVKDRRIEKDKEKPYNFLLEGDNLHSLKLLQKTHKGKIDVIYIDPPYNTGNKDFIYNDQYVDKTDGYSHSKWLSFVEKRLRIARELLTEEGVIFISIDDNEQAQLKLLCDEVFGGENFVNSISVKMSESTGVKMTHVGKRLPKLKEYILFYSKRIINLKLNEIKIPKDKWDDEYKILIEGVTKQELDEIKKIINAESITIEDIQNLDDICRKIRFSNISKLLNKVQNNDKLNILYENSYRIVRDVATSDGAKKIADSKRLEQNICEGAFLIKTAKNKGYLIRGDYSPVSKQPRMKLLFADQYLDIKIGDFWEDIKTTGLGNEGEVNLLNGKKPLKLLDRLLKLSSCKNSTILDFFAGSGTTGHAVAKLNAEDGGNRKYILCTNNENNICEDVTYKRLCNIQNELPHNLKYFKTDYIQKFSSDEVVSEMMLHICEMIELEHHINLDNKKYVLCYSEEKLQECIQNILVGGTLFITSGIFMTSNEQKILDEKHVNVVEVPEYYFSEELRELGEI